MMLSKALLFLKLSLLNSKGFILMTISKNDIDIDSNYEEFLELAW